MTLATPRQAAAFWHIDDAPMGVLVLADDGRILQVNRLLCGWLGRDATALAGSMVDAVFTPASRLLYHTYLLPLLKLHGRVAELSLALLSADGSRLDALVSAHWHIPASGAGEVRFAFTLMRERRKLEDQLRSAQRMAELVPGLLFEWRERPGHPPTMPYASEGLRELFGLSPQEALKDASAVTRAVHRDDLPRVQAELAEAAQALRSWRGTCRVCVGGRERWVETHATPTRAADGCLLWHGYASDVTERLQLELQAREREAAEQASQAKSAFLARVSHELRTPLNGILGFTQLLLGRDGVTDPHHVRHLRHVDAAGRTLLRLVDDVLDISRIDADQLSLHVQEVDAAALLRDCTGMLQPVAELRGCLFQGPALRSAWCRADPLRLQQCLLNLLSNAVKYGPAESQIDLDIEVTQESLSVRVRDRGPGFAPEQLKHLFEPFNRLGAERTSVDGTGLGLLITRKLVESMGGSLTVSNAEGGGACLSLMVPAVQVAVEVPCPQRVLYAEDSQVDAELMAAVFAVRPNWTLHVVRTAQEACTWGARHPPDLCLLSLDLLDRDGASLRDRLRTLPTCATVPMVAVTVDAMAIQGLRDQGQERGFDAWWLKPIQAEDVLNQLDVLLARSAAPTA